MISGLLVLNKPKGISSGEFIRKLKPLIQNSKIGHSGTLDPLARGIILACIGQMTRFTQYLANEKKTYIAEMTFGLKTNTGDLDGKVLQEDNFVPTKKDFNSILKKFVGNIYQEAPLFSSLKYKGKPMYQYARKGMNIPSKSRNIEIFSIDLISKNKNKFTFSVDCGKGTYIRSLVNDIARELNTVAVLSDLERISSADHNIKESHEIETINSDNLSNKLISMGDALRSLDEIQCAPEIIDRIINGQKVFLEEAKLKSIYLRLFDENKDFIGILKNNGGLVSPKRLLSIKN
ncbi:MAG: tRNA pseudouridine(55) synthase TruB [Gammaproteobacteria bacterium]|nr:MAG: tRNA pseudouridine(55) synthase TruB [Gammaproteobacteria bacterium]